MPQEVQAPPGKAHGHTAGLQALEDLQGPGILQQFQRCVGKENPGCAWIQVLEDAQQQLTPEGALPGREGAAEQEHGPQSLSGPGGRLPGLKGLENDRRRWG